MQRKVEETLTFDRTVNENHEALVSLYRHEDGQFTVYVGDDGDRFFSLQGFYDETMNRYIEALTELERLGIAVGQARINRLIADDWDKARVMVEQLLLLGKLDNLIEPVTTVSVMEETEWELRDVSDEKYEEANDAG